MLTHTTECSTSYQQGTNQRTKEQSTKNSGSCTLVVYIAGDALRHQPMGAGHMTVLQLRGPMGFRILPWWLYIAGDTLRHQPMGAGHMTVLQLRGLMAFRVLQWCHPMLASTKRTSCCTRIITLYGTRRGFRPAQTPSLPYIPINLNYDEFSQIRELYFHTNEFSFLPDYVYQVRHLKVADFSHNKITFSEIWLKNTTKQLSLSGPKTIYLQSNLITKLDLSVLNKSLIGQLHEILQNFHFHLNGNPINCNCDSFRMFKYLISSSRTERLNEQLDENHLPDFSFYKNRWKCVYPPEWAGIPIMQIPENEYDRKCVE